MSVYRPEFEAALLILGRISEALAARGLPRPILVGGGAVEYYTGSAVMTGDIDLTSPVQPELEDEMRRHGFVRPSGRGKSTRGWIHPDLRLGFEVVADVPMDGNVSRERLVLVDLAEGASFVMIPVEDLIAGRMGQYASGTARDRLDQARALLSLHPDADRVYLDRRIREETMGDLGVEDVRGIEDAEA